MSQSTSARSAGTTERGVRSNERCREIALEARELGDFRIGGIEMLEGVSKIEAVRIERPGVWLNTIDMRGSRAFERGVADPCAQDGIARRQARQQLSTIVVEIDPKARDAPARRTVRQYPRPHS